MTAREEAVKAAAEALYRGGLDRDAAMSLALLAVAAAAPILLAVERARIAAAIDQAWAEKKDSADARDYLEYHEGYLDGLEHAQRIAETAPEEG